MKTKLNRTIQFVVILVVALVIVRFLPVILRFLQLTMYTAKAYWWVILPALIITAVALKVRKHRLFKNKFVTELEQLPIRDVTKSTEFKSK
jgi:hypothetical protein